MHSAAVKDVVFFISSRLGSSAGSIAFDTGLAETDISIINSIDKIARPIQYLIAYFN